MRVLLVDISGIAYAIWHVSGKEPDQDYVSQRTVARIHAEADAFDHAIICCDSSRNFRKDISPEYKATREANEVVKHQLRLAQEQLAADGFQVWKADGYEADDLIASTVAHLRKKLPLEDGTDEVVILSADKDLMALVGVGVKVKSPASGNVYDREEVREKFGVYPERIVDLLCLMGDKSDNVPGIDGIGKVTGAKLLNDHGSLFELYRKLGDSCTVLGLTPRMFSLLKDNVATVELARRLITLQTDVALPFGDIFKPRSPKAPEQFEEENMAEVIDNDTGEVMQTPEPEKVEPRKSEPPPAPPQQAQQSAPSNVVQLPSDDRKSSVSLATVDWKAELEPRSPREVVAYAGKLFAARIFDGYGTPEGVMSTILLGRELNIGMMGSLRGIHLMDVRGKKKHVLSADLMAALVLQSPKCKFFEPVELTATFATYRTHRVGSEKPFTMTFKIEEAQQAGLVREGGNWKTWPLDMCKARCIARLARTVYPDVCFGLYVPEELEAA